MLVDVKEIHVICGEGRTFKATFMGFHPMPPGRWGGQMGVIVCHESGDLEHLAFEEVRFPPRPPQFRSDTIEVERG